MHDESADPGRGAHACQPTRLAESSVAAVDHCSCGVIQLHIGAFTLRFAPSAALELLGTLGDALGERAAHAGRSPNAALALGGRLGRGQA